jgi:hypothetical protein
MPMPMPMQLCAPIIIYIMFSLLQIILDLLKGLYNSAGVKLIISAIITACLYFLCKKGWDLVAWFIVLTPLLFVAAITAFVLYKLRLNTTFGNKCENGSSSTIINNPSYKHGYVHLYKYTTTPVQVRVTVSECQESDTASEPETVETVPATAPIATSSKSRYLDTSDPAYIS